MGCVNYSHNDVEALAELFKSINNSTVANGEISKEEFKSALFNNSEKQHIMADRIFDLFDVKKKGKIYFDDFVRSLSIFPPNTPPEAKINFSFRLFDLNDNGFIERQEVKHVVIATVDELELGVNDEAIEALLDKTFLDMDQNKDGQIDIHEWRSFVTHNPNLIKFMTIPSLREITTYFPGFILNTTMDDDQLISQVLHAQSECSTSTARNAQPGGSTSAAPDAQPECSTSVDHGQP
ncbi:calcineurin B-like molecule protein [Medicago truncatula]|uniref:Calcineurin B-like protein n=1 Tax=Medicago truncatula TaxID=3880 RepID=A0A072USN2_MEDTR|nr:calcineurin B-like molecule protein [Medicago truncatula]